MASPKIHALDGAVMSASSGSKVLIHPRARRDFAKYVECVADSECARVVAVTSPERAAAAQEERPGFFDAVHTVL